MTTNRIDHTACTHARTAKGRAGCRNRRNAVIRTAQTAYAVLWVGVETPSHAAYDEYYALVDDVAICLGVALRDAYEIVENGPVVS